MKEVAKILGLVGFGLLMAIGLTEQREQHIRGWADAASDGRWDEAGAHARAAVEWNPYQQPEPE